MAKKKRTHTNIVTKPKILSHTQQERSHIIAQKMLRLFGMEPELLDLFTKRQKQLIFGLIFEFPSVKAEKENTVPRRFVEKIREEMLKFMKSKYFGKSEYGITYMDFIIYGYAFYNLLSQRVADGTFAGTPQGETAKMICEKIENSEIFTDEGFEDLQDFLIYQTRSYSQVNFRLYGFNFEFVPVATKRTIDGFTTMQMRIQLTVQNCEPKTFTYNKIDRKAFRLIYTADGEEITREAVIKRNKIYPNANEDEKLNIYIQSHVLQRFKQRVDILESNERNYLIQHILIDEQKVIHVEKQVLIMCTIDGCLPIGYFTFFIRDCDLVVNTFLPLTSESAPEGKRLREILPLKKDDFIYLGMDKLSFYTTIDFEQIPILKKALIDANIWETKLALDRTLLKKGEIAIDANRTMFVKNYFDKLGQYRTDSFKFS